MIQNVSSSGRRIRVRASERLRVHFLALARRVAAWHRPGASNGGVAIGIAGVEARAGVSTVALNLAASLAGISRGNVLLVDCGFDRTGVSRRAPRPGHGLGEVLSGDQAPSSCIHETSIDRLFVMTSGRIEGRAAIGLPFENTRNLNSDLADNFDYLIYDLPVANDMTHCYPIAQYLDALLLVADSTRINEEKINRAARRLEEMETALIGLALNKS